ncbi:LOW QUALITY PROTEIN: TPTE2 isoform 6 [Pongo abelii]|uniref:TPTE2 isoform 6 n=1 Tax=Pongo abelii TaxID=9601 RepID=A0A2J8QZI7_PONAB|nr:LOW QUALITY PROTEIN: TPTE2 isoform 6 [Pongo abelii]
MNERVARFLDKKHPNHYRVYNLCRRTGTMVCALLIAFEIFLTAEESLYYFGERRTDKTHSNKFQGVETPSQNRYVGYFAQVKHLYNWNLPPRQILFIKRFIIYSIRGDVCDLEVQIVMEKKVVFSSTSLGNCSREEGSTQGQLEGGAIQETCARLMGGSNSESEGGT